MIGLIVLVVAAVLLCTNVVAWAAFRIDKHRAKQAGRRRIPERRLLWFAAFGGGGALVAMYAHRRRHKVDKRRFRAWVWALVTMQVAALGGAAYLAFT